MEIAGSHVSAHVVRSRGGSVPSPEDFFLAVDALRREQEPHDRLVAALARGHERRDAVVLRRGFRVRGVHDEQCGDGLQS